MRSFCRLSSAGAEGANFATPAFTNNTSILPDFCETSHYNLSTSVSLATSAGTATTPFPIIATAALLITPTAPSNAPE